MNLRTEPFPYVIIDDLYNEYELTKICTELSFLSDKLRGPEDSGSAMDEDKNYTKQNKGIYLDQVIEEVGFSNIDYLNKKVYSYLKDVDNWYYHNLRVNTWNTLISYYDDVYHYKTHFDSTILTILTWFYVEPKRFTGGDLYFNDYDITIECKHNRCVIFPGHIGHSVPNVVLNEKGYGRWCMSQFGTFDETRPSLF